MRWRTGAEKQAVEAMKVTALAIREEARLEPDDSSMHAWARQSQNREKIQAALGLAESEESISVNVDELDSDPLLLNLKNGTLELKGDFRFRPHNRADLITKLSPITYDQDAQCPEFLKFINRILPDQEVCEFVQRWFGYCLTGSISEQVFLAAFGEGANGKTQLLEVFRKILGTDYTFNATFGMFGRRANGGLRPEMAQLKGVRLVTASDGGDGGGFEEELIKQVTGGDAITARLLYRNPIQFMPQFKMIFATNRKPTIEGQENAIWRRIRLVPFDVVIPEDDREQDIHARLVREEASGILNWAIHGLRRQQSTRLCPPSVVLAATKSYRDEEDVIGEFLRDRCEPVAIKEESSTDLYRAFWAWCDNRGEKPMSQKMFSLGLRRKGYQLVRKSWGKVFVGIGLKAA
jgi:putative DNA primase/helicase